MDRFKPAAAARTLPFLLLILLLLVMATLEQQQSADISSAQPLNSRLEFRALLQLRSSLGLRAKEWPIKSNPCLIWAGITCRNGNVVGINISGFRRTRVGRKNPQFAVDALVNFTHLEVFNASYFTLPGQIPGLLGQSMDNLQVLDLRSCSIIGSIPASLGGLTRLRTLNLSENSLTGTIPSGLSGLLNLSALDLSRNSLNGYIPPSIFQPWTRLNLVNISHNDFSGAIPDVLWSMSSMQLVDVSSNNFTGRLPKITLISNTTGLLFNLSYNMYYGQLTSVIKRFSFVDLSGNYFEGKVQLSAGWNASFGENCLQNFTNQKTLEACSSFYNSKGLSFDNFGFTNSSGAPIDLPQRKSHKKTIILASVLGGAGLLLLLLLLLLLILCTRKRGRLSQRGNGVGPIPTAATPQSSGVSINFASLGDAYTKEQLVLATDGFSESNLIKHGHSGDLYRGLLEGGIPVVIKKIDLNAVRREGYLSELEFFSKVSHPRLVTLLGHCLENEDEKYLLYKYMPNGDLSSSLYRKVNSDDDSLQSLDWITRLKIAIGAAEGLCYLHHECSPPFVHRNVQASSILLDDKFEVRLGSLTDIGVQEGDAHQSMISRFLRIPQSSDQGTSGSHSSTCAYDVYCFGKVLLELVTGKLGISASSDDATKEWLDQMIPYISIHEEELITKIVDPSLMYDEDLLKEVWAMAIVARSCLNPKPSRRPLMRYILKALENPLKVVREDSHGSARLRTTSSRGSWNAAVFGSWRHSSSDVAAPGMAGPGSISKVVEGGGPSSLKQSVTSESQGSGGGAIGVRNDNSSSQRRQSRDIFPEPFEVETQGGE